MNRHESAERAARRPPALCLWALLAAGAVLLWAVAPAAIDRAAAGPDAAAAAQQGGKGRGKGNKGGKGHGGSTVGKKKRSRVTVATTGNRSERFKTLPITESAWQKPRVLMSLSPRRAPRLLSGDRFRVSSELQLTTNCQVEKRRCNGPPYRYSPRVDVELRIARDTRPHRGRRTRLLAKGHEVCGRASREHHCVIVLRTRELPSKRGLNNCRPVACRINLIASARHPRADPGARLMVGGQRPDGTVPQDRGRINIVHIRERKREVRSRTFRTRRLRSDSVPVDGLSHSVISQPLRVHRGDKLEVTARLRTSVEELPYMTQVSSQLILAGSPGQEQPGSRGARAGFFAGEIDERNGFNCTLQRGRCKIEKVGVMKIKRKVKRPLYVNLTMLAGAKKAVASEQDTQRLLQGRLQVTRYR